MAVRVDPQAVREAVAARLEEARRFLCDLVAAPSPPGQEAAAMELAERAFAAVADVRRAAMTNTLKQDPDYSDSLPDLDYDGRCNLLAAYASPSAWKRGRGPAGRSLIWNAHLDAVPPSAGQAAPYRPEVRGGAVWGRGACDAKGQAATAFLALAALRDLDVELAGELTVHLVVEEELGGNGTLALVRAGQRADACVVLEPTDLKVLPRSRGAVWYRLTFRGRPGHSGQAAVTRNAIDMAVRAIEVLRRYHAELLEASRGEVLFDLFPNPMPLTIGSLHAGNWPAIAPGEAVLEGVLGFLPNRTARQVMHEMTTRLAHEGGDLLAGNFDIHFTYRHDASVVPSDAPLVTALQDAARSVGVKAPIEAMTASCDACFYTNQAQTPAVVFGGGSLSVAHGDDEHMPIADLAAAAEVLVSLAVQWCGHA
jgi:acetylornithine deacetylase